jgi:glycosyltransferase involved in cell wall biosynthesis
LAATLGRSTSILFVGSGEQEAELRARAALSAGVRARFHGFAHQAELPGLYASSRVFLFPTKSDVWGVVANEACAAGLPIISTPSAGAVGEIILDGVNAFVRDPDGAQWAVAAQRLLTDRRLYQAYSDRSQRIVADYTYVASASGVVNAALAAVNSPPR